MAARDELESQFHWVSVNAVVRTGLDVGVDVGPVVSVLQEAGLPVQLNSAETEVRIAAALSQFSPVLSQRFHYVPSVGWVADVHTHPPRRKKVESI